MTGEIWVIVGVLFCGGTLAVIRIQTWQAEQTENEGAVDVYKKPKGAAKAKVVANQPPKRGETWADWVKREFPAWFAYPALDEGAGNLLIVGRKGSGKSTLAYALLATRARAGHKIVVLDPHANFNSWPVPAIGGGRDFVRIEATLKALLSEFDRRYSLGKNDVLEPLTIFIDEMPSIKEFCPSAKQFFLAGAREFRKINMTLVILTQSANVKSLGIEGEGDSKANFMLFHLADKALARMPQNEIIRVAGCRPVVVEQDGFCCPADLNQIFITQLATLDLSSGCVWQPPTEAVTLNFTDAEALDDDDDDDDDDGSGSQVPEFSGGHTSLKTVGNREREPELDAGTDPELDRLVIIALSKSGINRTRIAKYLGGRKADTLAKIKSILENGEV